MTNTVTTIIDDHSKEASSNSASQSTSVCPECDGLIIQDDEHGEVICEDCGLVLDTDMIDHGPDWRAYNSKERDEKSRIGAPATELMHDKGLSTTIGWQDKDAYGHAISEQKQAQLQRLRQWDERFRTKDAHERNLKQAFGEIRRMASALGLPNSIRETAGVLYRRAVEDDLLPGRSIEGMATAALYTAARQHSTPRTLAELETVSRVKQIRIQRAYRYLSRELELEMEPVDPLRYIPQFASKLDVSDEATRRARDLLTTAKAHGVHTGRKPAGLAAGAIYAATCLTNEHLTQRSVQAVTHVSRMTIRARYQELLEVYGSEGHTA